MRNKGIEHMFLKKLWRAFLMSVACLNQFWYNLCGRFSHFIIRNPRDSIHIRKLWKSCKDLVQCKTHKTFTTFMGQCNITILETCNASIIMWRYSDMYLITLESSWQSFHDMTWLILDLGTQYFDIWDTFQSKKGTAKLLWNSELYISSTLPRVYFKGYHISQKSGD